MQRTLATRGTSNSIDCARPVVAVTSDSFGTSFVVLLRWCRWSLREKLRQAVLTLSDCLLFGLLRIQVDPVENLWRLFLGLFEAEHLVLVHTEKESDVKAIDILL